MFGWLIMWCRNLICPTPECWWRSRTRLSFSQGSIFSNHVCGTLFCPSRTTLANVSCCSFNSQNLWDITALFVAVKFTTVPLTSGFVTNTEGFCRFWSFSCISVHSVLPISAYIRNISTWFTKYFDSYHIKWWTLAWRGHNGTTICKGGSYGSTL